MALLKAKTKCGVVAGVRGNAPGISIFKGIPYAAPPVGALRFCGPQPPKTWQGELKCDDFGPTPVEDLSQNMGGYGREFYPVQMPASEDCLRLHIWTPAQSDAEFLPVMVWYHGGGYNHGYAYEMEFDGEAICRRGCIFVSVGYRLGPLGFLAHPYLSARSENGRSGNYGSLDQIFALAWVRDNIKAFGGNPDNVTIFGQSAGGGSVRTMLASPLARGLFHRAVIQSAGGLGAGLPSGIMAEDEHTGEMLVKELGWKPEELLTRSAQEIYFKLLDMAERTGNARLFRPTVDGWLLTQTAENAIKSGDIAPVPLMCGAVAGDNADRANAFKGAPDYDEIKSVIAATETISMGHVYGKNNWNPVYCYYFDRKLPGDRWGESCFHSCELWYTFGTLYRCWRPFTGYDYELSAAMTDYWTNFAKHGNPNGSGLPLWPSYTPKTPDVMNFGNKEIKVKQYIRTPAVHRLVEENLKSSGLEL